jgi:trehalose/maltose hydrolase-like predicted phosphorylase
LKLDPALPERWSVVEAPLLWRGQRVIVRASKGRVEVKNLSSRALDAQIWGERRTVPPRGSDVWSK